jgi:hypothetical protein
MTNEPEGVLGHGHADLRRERRKSFPIFAHLCFPKYDMLRKQERAMLSPSCERVLSLRGACDPSFTRER